jgi:A/G-specific adenine glycosylase
MELGATYCSPSGSGIEEGDPLKHFYASTRLGVAIGLAIKCDSLASTQTVPGTHTGKSQCRLCDPDGVSSIFYDVVDRINASSKTTTLNPQMVSAISGHAAIPMPPPKKAKREEVLAVGVICLEHTNKNDHCWLMVKRPSDGLLAGQWEFPSVCLWSSVQKDSKAKSSSGKLSGAVQVPCIDASVRSTELNSYIHDVFQSTASDAKVKKELSSASKKRVQLDDPIVHIFSHVCHTMWVEYGKVNSNKFDCEKRWKLKDGREAGWFTSGDMRSVGITSGVRKVLALVEKNE